MFLFERFDEQGKATLAGAYRISRRFNHAEVDPDHYLLALLEQIDDSTARILKQLAVNEEALRTQIEARVSAKPKAQIPESNQVFITPLAKRVLERAVEELARLHDAMLQPEHLLLAILHDDSLKITQILNDQGVTYARVDEVIREAGKSASG